MNTIKVDFLKGTRILLIAHYIPGGVAGYLLGGLGAEIIKIEPPNGEMMRDMPPFMMGADGMMNAYFRAFNAGFKSVALDLKSPEGAEKLRRLIPTADVLFDGNRPGFLEKVLGKKVTEIDKNIIYIPITGQGIIGPLKDLAAHDNNCLARAGNLSFTPKNSEGMPSVFSAQVADISTGTMAAFMAVSALMGKQNKQSEVEVRTIDTSMLHASFFLNQMYVSGMNITKTAPQPSSETLNGGLANYRMYKTQDEKALFFGPLEPKLFKNFCQAVGRNDLQSLLFIGNPQLIRELTELFASKTMEDWNEVLGNCDCCCTPVNDLQQAIDDPQIQALGLVQTVEDKEFGSLTMAGYPAGFTEESLPPEIAAWAPKVGEHNSLL